MARMKRQAEAVPWFLQTRKVRWQEDDATSRHSPGHEGLTSAWRRVVGTELPAELERYDGGDIFYSFGGGNIIWAHAYDGASIYELLGVPSLWDLRRTTEALDEACRADLGRPVRSLNHLQWRTVLSRRLKGRPDHEHTVPVLDQLSQMQMLTWMCRRELPTASVVRSPLEGARKATEKKPRPMGQLIIPGMM